MIVLLAAAVVVANSRPVSNTAVDNYSCNLAVLAVSQTAVRLKPYKRSSITGTVRKTTPLYVCDEKQAWYKIYYSGRCSAKSMGILFSSARKCKSGWIRRQAVRIISG